MSSEITFDADIADPDRLRPILSQLTETLARRMKQAGVVGKGVTLTLKTAEFRTLTRARRLPRATRSAEEMFQTAAPLLAREADGRAFRLIGIGAHDLVEARRATQGDLFDGASLTASNIDTALDGRCCMKTLRGWGGLARTSRDPPQEPHYRNAVEGPSHV